MGAGVEEVRANEIASMLKLYGDPKASAAGVLCDRHDPSRVAYTIVAQDQSARELTYGQLRLESSKLAAGLWSLGLRPGDRIATLMAKGHDYLVTVMAIWRLGAVHLPLFTAFGPAAIAYRLAASGCKLIVCDAAQRGKLATGDGPPADPSWKIVTTAAIEGGALPFSELQQSGHARFGSAVLGGNAPIIHIYTSGTTGDPKGVVVPLRAAASFNAYATYGLGILPDDVFWNAADPGWAYGLYFGVVGSFVTGVRSVLLEGGFSPRVTLAVLENFGVTNFAAAPTVFRSMRASGLEPQRPLKLRCASSAGEPLTPEVIEWSRAVLGVPVHDHYGQTELGMLINNHHHPALRRPLKPGSMGEVMPGWKTRVLALDRDEPASQGEVGRLAVDLTQSPLAWFNGYAEDPATGCGKFCGGGRWYLTGDCARVDEDGYYYFTARDDDVIIMAGYRIGPVEVESALLSHPAVAECGVVAGPDEIRGEVLEAFVVLKATHAPSGELTAEIQDWVKQRYAAHAYPRRIHYLQELPRTPSGKVQRFLLRQRLQNAARTGKAGSNRSSK